MSLKKEQLRELMNKANEAKKSGMSLCGVFEDFAKENGLARGTVRNVYYDIVKRAQTDTEAAEEYFGDFTLSSAKIVGFDRIEARTLLKKILLGATFGKPVRRTIAEMTSDPVLALRYQNKYRNMLRFDRAEVDEVSAEIKSEYGRCFDPYKKTPRDATVMRLKHEINGLYDRIAEGVRLENERLTARVKSLEAENDRLKEIIGKQGGKIPVFADYFKLSGGIVPEISDKA